MDSWPLAAGPERIIETGSMGPSIARLRTERHPGAALGRR